MGPVAWEAPGPQLYVQGLCECCPIKIVCLFLFIRFEICNVQEGIKELQQYTQAAEWYTGINMFFKHSGFQMFCHTYFFTHWKYQLTEP